MSGRWIECEADKANDSPATHVIVKSGERGHAKYAYNEQDSKTSKYCLRR